MENKKCGPSTEPSLRLTDGRVEAGGMGGELKESRKIIRGKRRILTSEPLPRCVQLDQSFVRLLT